MSSVRKTSRNCRRSGGAITQAAYLRAFLGHLRCISRRWTAAVPNRRTKAILSLTLIPALVTLPIRVTAQDQTPFPPVPFDLLDSASGPGPLARSAALEAIRLGAGADKPTTSAREDVEQGRQAGPSDWSHVREIVPGTEVVMTVGSAQPATCYLLAANAIELWVLNGADPALSAEAKNLLRGAVSRKDVLLAVAASPLTGGLLLPRKGVRIQADGVFVDGRKVADAGQVEHIVRADVAEIRVFVRRPSVNRSATWGGVIGAVAGVTAALLTCKTPSCDPAVTSVAAVTLGFAIGCGIGALVGVSGSKTWNVIYRAP